MHFEGPGIVNTAKTLEIAFDCALTRGVRDIIVASTTGYSEERLIAGTLRMFSQGVKVCVEIAAMAVDAGLVPPSDVIAVAGTGQGADTACIVKGDCSSRFFSIRIREILVKPREF